MEYQSVFTVLDSEQEAAITGGGINILTQININISPSTAVAASFALFSPGSNIITGAWAYSGSFQGNTGR